MASDDDLPLPTPLQPLVAGRLHTAVPQVRLKPGPWLSQHSLAEEFHMSQVPVRTAFDKPGARGALRDQEPNQR
jgi:DNA-binding GntR family transcriptional regulator